MSIIEIFVIRMTKSLVPKEFLCSSFNCENRDRLDARYKVFKCRNDSESRLEGRYGDLSLVLELTGKRGVLRK